MSGCVSARHTSAVSAANNVTDTTTKRPKLTTACWCCHLPFAPFDFWWHSEGEGIWIIWRLFLSLEECRLFLQILSLVAYKDILKDYSMVVTLALLFSLHVFLLDSDLHLTAVTTVSLCLCNSTGKCFYLTNCSPVWLLPTDLQHRTSSSLELMQKSPDVIVIQLTSPAPALCLLSLY